MAFVVEKAIAEIALIHHRNADGVEGTTNAI